ncbi:uncharacterized protein LOC141914262 [Tubulanus polymorphus]|uniref:uncharacterized protein LOC141914262 n=1 Tax=Tubulanus polymorphus TaxID=672921 RepID=UPI003DA6566C
MKMEVQSNNGRTMRLPIATSTATDDIVAADCNDNMSASTTTTNPYSNQLLRPGRRWQRRVASKNPNYRRRYVLLVRSPQKQMMQQNEERDEASSSPVCHQHPVVPVTKSYSSTMEASTSSGYFYDDDFSSNYDAIDMETFQSENISSFFAVYGGGNGPRPDYGEDRANDMTLLRTKSETCLLNGYRDVELSMSEKMTSSQGGRSSGYDPTSSAEMSDLPELRDEQLYSPQSYHSAALFSSTHSAHSSRSAALFSSTHSTPRGATYLSTDSLDRTDLTTSLTTEENFKLDSCCAKKENYMLSFDRSPNKSTDGEFDEDEGEDEELWVNDDVVVEKFNTGNLVARELHSDSEGEFDQSEAAVQLHVSLKNYAINEKEPLLGDDNETVSDDETVACCSNRDDCCHDDSDMSAMAVDGESWSANDSGVRRRVAAVAEEWNGNVGGASDSEDEQTENDCESGLLDELQPNLNSSLESLTDSFAYESMEDCGCQKLMEERLTASDSVQVAPPCAHKLMYSYHDGLAQVSVERHSNKLLKRWNNVQNDLHSVSVTTDTLPSNDEQTAAAATTTDEQLMTFATVKTDSEDSSGSYSEGAEDRLMEEIQKAEERFLIAELEKMRGNLATIHCPEKSLLDMSFTEDRSTDDSLHHFEQIERRCMQPEVVATTTTLKQNVVGKSASDHDISASKTLTTWGQQVKKKPVPLTSWQKVTEMKEFLKKEESIYSESSSIKWKSAPSLMSSSCTTITQSLSENKENVPELRTFNGTATTDDKTNKRHSFTLYEIFRRAKSTDNDDTRCRLPSPLYQKWITSMMSHDGLLSRSGLTSSVASSRTMHRDSNTSSLTQSALLDVSTDTSTSSNTTTSCSYAINNLESRTPSPQKRSISSLASFTTYASAPPSGKICWKNVSSPDRNPVTDDCRNPAMVAEVSLMPFIRTNFSCEATTVKTKTGKQNESDGTISVSVTSQSSLNQSNTTDALLQSPLDIPLTNPFREEIIASLSPKNMSPSSSNGNLDKTDIDELDVGVTRNNRQISLNNTIDQSIQTSDSLKRGSQSQKSLQTSLHNDLNSNEPTAASEEETAAAASEEETAAASEQVVLRRPRGRDPDTEGAFYLSKRSKRLSMPTNLHPPKPESNLQRQRPLSSSFMYLNRNLPDLSFLNNDLMSSSSCSDTRGRKLVNGDIPTNRSRSASGRLENKNLATSPPDKPPRIDGTSVKVAPPRNRQIQSVGGNAVDSGSSIDSDTTTPQKTNLNRPLPTRTGTKKKVTNAQRNVNNNDSDGDGAVSDAGISSTGSSAMEISNDSSNHSSHHHQHHRYPPHHHHSYGAPCCPHHGYPPPQFIPYPVYYGSYENLTSAPYMYDYPPPPPPGHACNGRPVSAAARCRPSSWCSSEDVRNRDSQQQRSNKKPLKPCIKPSTRRNSTPPVCMAPPTGKPTCTDQVDNHMSHAYSDMDITASDDSSAPPSEWRENDHGIAHRSRSKSRRQRAEFGSCDDINQQCNYHRTRPNAFHYDDRSVAPYCQHTVPQFMVPYGFIPFMPCFHGNCCHGRKNKKSVKFAEEVRYHSPYSSPRTSPKKQPSTSKLLPPPPPLHHDNRCNNHEYTDDCHPSDTSEDSAFGSETPPQEFTVSPTRVLSYNFREEEVIDTELINKKSLVKELSHAVDVLVNYFNNGGANKEKLGRSSDSPDVGILVLKHLCPAVFNLISDGLKPKIHSFFGQFKNSVWKLIEESIDSGPSARRLSDIIQEVKHQIYLGNTLSKFNAFIFGLLNAKTLPYWMKMVHNQDRLLRKHFYGDAFMILTNNRGQHLFDEVMQIVKPLVSLPFQIECNFEYKLVRNASLSNKASEEDDSDSEEGQGVKLRPHRSEAECRMQNEGVEQIDRHNDIMRYVQHAREWIENGTQLSQSAMDYLGQKLQQEYAPHSVARQPSNNRWSLPPIETVYSLANFFSKSSSASPSNVSAPMGGGNMEGLAMYLAAIGQNSDIFPQNNDYSKLSNNTNTGGENVEKIVKNNQILNSELYGSDSSSTPVAEDFDTNTWLVKLARHLAEHDKTVYKEGVTEYRFDNNATAAAATTGKTPSLGAKTLSQPNISSTLPPGERLSDQKRWSIGENLINVFDKLLLDQQQQPTTTVTTPGGETEKQTTSAGNKLRSIPRMDESISAPKRYVQSLCYHVAGVTEQLSFNKNDIMLVLKELEDDWLFCCYGNKTGLVHRASVKDITETTAVNILHKQSVDIATVAASNDQQTGGTEASLLRELDGGQSEEDVMCEIIV